MSCRMVYATRKHGYRRVCSITSHVNKLERRRDIAVVFTGVVQAHLAVVLFGVATQQGKGYSVVEGQRTRW